MYINKNESVWSPEMRKSIRECLSGDAVWRITTDTPEKLQEVTTGLLSEGFLRGKSMDIKAESALLRQMLKEGLKKLALDRFAIDMKDEKSAEILLEKLRDLRSKDMSSGRIDRAHFIKMEFEYRQILREIQLHYQTLLKVVLADMRLIDVLARYDKIRTHLPLPHHINALTAARYLKLHTDEFWALYGMVKRGAKLYAQHPEAFTRFEELHPVLFDMFSLKDAIQHFFNGLHEELKRITRLRNEISHWLLGYERNFILSLKEQWRELQQKGEQLLMKLKIHQSTDSKVQGGLLKLFSRGVGKRQETVLFEAYNHWYEACQVFPVKGLKVPPKLDHPEELPSVLKEIASVFKQDNQLHIRQYVIRRMERLTLFNIDETYGPAGFLKERIQEIKEVLKSVETRQLFRTTPEDNHMYIHQKLSFLDGLYTKWKKMYEEQERFELSFLWRQFFEALDEKSKDIVLALQQFSPKEWPLRFEMWYYRQLLDTQFTLHIRETEQILNALLNAHKVYQQTTKMMAISARNESMINELNILLKGKKKLKPLIEKADPVDHLPEPSILLNFLSLFFFRINVERDNAVADEQLFLELTGETQGAYTLYCNMLGKGQKANQTERILTISYPSLKNLDKGIVRSTHSDRWGQIKTLAGYVHSFLPHARLYENTQSIVISTIPNPQLERKALDPIGSDWLVRDIASMTPKNIAEQILDTRTACSIVTLDGMLIEGHSEMELLWNAHLFELFNHAGIPIRVLRADRIWTYEMVRDETCPQPVDEGREAMIK